MGVPEYIALGSLLVAVIALLSTFRKDSRADLSAMAADKAETRAKLDSIGNGVDDIRVEYRTVRQRVDNMASDLASVKSSCSSAHHRLDGIEARLNHNTPVE